MDKYEQLKRAWADHKRQEAAFAAGCGIMPGMPDMPSAGLASDFWDLVIENIDALLADADEIAALKADRDQWQDGTIIVKLADAEAEIDRLCAALKLAQARAGDYEADIEAGRLVRFEGGEPYWYCPHCREEVGSYSVTYGELHDRCGHPVEWIKPVKRAALEGGQANDADWNFPKS